MTIATMQELVEAAKDMARRKTAKKEILEAKARVDKSMGETTG